MNTQQAKQIQLIALLSLLGYEPDYKYQTSYWYKSPIRNERRASFRVNLEKNTWVDQSTGTGGNIIDFVMQYQNNCGVGEALAYIAKITNNPHNYNSALTKLQTARPKKNNAPKIEKIRDIENKALIDYLKSRKVPVELAKLYLKECYYYIGKNHYFGLCWKNNSEGLEIRNKYFKTATNKAFSFVPGKCTKMNVVNVFEGMFDFLSALVYSKTQKPKYDCLIMNSTALARSPITIGYLYCYDKANLFMDNDQAGDEATQFLCSKLPRVADYRNIYQNHNDFNDFLVESG
ncbi:toprim domain-containing protein [uncultured Microscilla sp.]|uniref:toprim domain-containing protein n=1 Tax=uncultured Microscilla sp. TaxID=432653 RepID=UPI002603E2E7|nr:toprim domain-containing protein [uncultured Microscilla sp.]